ncbi:hypothetical protein [Pseudomonas sp. PDM09]|uniref:hypothetical protein n=1 Tax=Pseudomonas sp. PDM09 TaxID=2769270 RepID=UPI0017820A18|nr:hypothetical protein [Pseudomonas sp. PDM09]MBD9562968.1 hypothetical protein [Pseudomonas sp. PDM09]
MADGQARSAPHGASNRIKHALHLPGWSFSDGDKGALRRSGTPVLVSEYDVDMKGSIFCPECCCPLFRNPEEEDANKRGRSAFFAHKRGIKTDCSLRTKKAVGKYYDTEEEAAQAVVDGELVVVKGFMQSRPVSPEVEPDVYDQTKVEDLHGELSDVPIGRHRGKKFKVPSVVTSIAGLCRGFDKNLYKYYYFPEAQYAQLLMDALRALSPSTDVTEEPVLVFGTVMGVRDAGPNPWNVRMVFMKFVSSNGYKDFCLKMSCSDGDYHKIDSSAVGRVAIAYGRIQESGIGLALNDLKWGEVSLLPKKYEDLLKA